MCETSSKVVIKVLSRAACSAIVVIARWSRSDWLPSRSARRWTSWALPSSAVTGRLELVRCDC